MPPEGSDGMMDVTKARMVVHDPVGTQTVTSHCDMEVNQVAIVKELTSGGYLVTVTGTELALISSALDEAERVTRFGIEVLDEADRGGDGEPSVDSPLLREIDVLAMREASLRSLQKTMAEVDGGGKLAPTRHTDLDPGGFGAALPIPRPR